ncbi:hypothetical protein [Erythrobacter sp. CCH5-A1]|uniref:hypothetical protein n=1 Tax=Erythrobacter sp. CCH5-A1 TaxID=1768792 RepID=UPI000ADAA3AF|nr:hypothetical protein [Erythrobacter sp. CCH5-A1]
MLTEIILGALGDAAIQYAGSKGFAWLKSRESKEELAAIAAASLEAVIPGVPALAEDLRTESFAKGVVVPMLEALVADPSQLPDTERLADQYIRMFVERFAGDSGADDALKRIFQTEPSELKSAFVIFFSAFRSRLYQSKHWRELGHFAATEATFKNTEAIKSALEGMAQRNEADAIDLDRARQDARSGSDELRNWPRAISGHELTRPELERLKTQTDILQVACRLTSRSPDFARWASVFRPERCLSSRKRPKSGGSSLEPAAFWPGRAAFPRGRRTCPAAFVQLGHGSWSCA